MLRVINSTDIRRGEEYLITVDEVNQCPICKNYISPQLLNSVILYSDFTRESIDQIPLLLSLQYLCNACYDAFIVNYHKNISLDEIYLNLEKMTFDSTSFECTVAPSKHVEKTFSPEIENVSSEFVNIYHQASFAENENLDQIAGMGYRKSLEFLIKDFLISEKPEEEEFIKKEQLGKCISELIDDKNLKTVAKRAAWLGNDQTHYVAKFKDKDIEDLKIYIELTIRWIETILLTRKAEGLKPKY